MFINLIESINNFINENQLADNTHNLLNLIPEDSFESILRITSLISGSKIIALGLLNNDENYIRYDKGFHNPDINNLIGIYSTVITEHTNENIFDMNHPKVSFYSIKEKLTVDLKDLSKDKFETLNHISHEIINLISLNKDKIHTKNNDNNSYLANKFFNTLFMSNRGLIIVSDKNKLIAVNEQLSKILGYSRDDLLGKNLNFITYNEDVKELTTGINKLLSKEIDLLNLEMRFITKTSEIIWFSITSSLIVDEKNNSSYHFIIFLEDINKRKIDEIDLKNANYQLQKEKVELQALIDAGDHYIVSIDKNYKILYFNNYLKDKIFKIRNILLQEGMSYKCLFSEKSIFEWEKHFKRALNGEKFYIEYKSFSNGKEKYFEIFFNPVFHLGNVESFTIYSKDITERKTIEKEIRISKSLLEKEQKSLTSIFNSTDIAICLYDKDGKITYFNKKYSDLFYEMHGWLPSEETLLKDLYILSDEYEYWKDLQQRILKGEKVTTYRDFVSNGNKRYIEISYNPIILSDKVEGFTTFVNDITSKKLLENELIKSMERSERANKAKSIFLATMSHEIRTPMNGVIGMTSLLLETQLTDEQKEFMNIIRVSGNSLLTIINDILDFSKIESGVVDFEEISFNLSEVIEESLDMLSPKSMEKKLDLIYFMDNDVPENFIGDPNRIKQILINLVSNAIKFTHNGYITLSIGLLSLDNKSSKLYFTLKDTGIGISPEGMKKLFKPFSQADSSTNRKYGGTGLGLAITKRIIEMMNGDIWIDSVENEGTTFTFTIWLQNDKLHNKNIKFIGKDILKDKKVLMIDNNLEKLDILGYKVKKWGMKSIKSNQDNISNLINFEKDIDLIIMEQEIAERDSYSLLKNILGNYEKDIPVLLLKCCCRSYIKNDLIKGYIDQPIKYSNLFNKLVQTIGVNKKEDKFIYNENILTKDITPSKLKILLAEDNLINQKLAVKIFEKLGYITDTAINGLEVLKKLESNNYDIIFMDIQMPEMDGIEATMYILKNYKNPPLIVAMTANALIEDRELCLKIGMVDHIPKPVTFEIIKQALDKYSNILKK